MIHKITINSFRGLDKLIIDDVGLVNIFVGGNGVGKTSVLEAIAIAANASGPLFLNNIALWREMPALTLTSEFALRTLFPQLNTSHSILIELAEEKGVHRLKIDAIRDLSAYLASGNGQLAQLALPTTYRTEDSAQMIWGVNYDYSAPQLKNSRKASLLLRSDVSIDVSKTHFSSPGCFYVHARRATSPGETAAVVTRLVKEKKRNLLLEALQLIEPKLTDILPEVVGGESVISVDIGLERYVPMNVLGDGFCRAALMITGMLSAKSQLVVVDEVDSGLHYSVMTAFWKAVLDLAKEFHFQLFATTHSDEMLQHTLDAFADQPDKLRVYRLDRTEQGITAQKYTYEMLRDSDFAGIEIR